MAKSVPRDIMIEILKQLPVKSLMRFQCVSKFWCLIIRDSNFIKTHLSFSLEKQNFDKSYFVQRGPNEWNWSNPECDFYFCDQTLAERKPWRFPFLSISGASFDVVGSCNGVICLTGGLQKSHGRVVYLWNPCINKIKILDGSVLYHSLPDKVSLSTSLGLGFDKQNSDYKVVRILYNCLAGSLVEVYSLRRDRWQSFQGKFPIVFSFSSLGTDVNGIIHWFAHVAKRRYKSIISLDLDKEEVGEILLPYYQLPKGEVDSSVWVYKGLLSFIFLERQERWHFPLRCCIWGMTEYGNKKSWSMLLSVYWDAEMEKPICTGWNGELLLQNNDGSIVSCQPRPQVYLNFEHYNLKMVNYIDSLVLLDKGRNAVEYMISLSRGDTCSGAML